MISCAKLKDDIYNLKNGKQIFETKPEKYILMWLPEHST